MNLAYSEVDKFFSAVKLLGWHKIYQWRIKLHFACLWLHNGHRVLMQINTEI